MVMMVIIMIMMIMMVVYNEPINTPIKLTNYWGKKNEIKNHYHWNYD